MEKRKIEATKNNSSEDVKMNQLLKNIGKEKKFSMEALFNVVDFSGYHKTDRQLTDFEITCQGKTAEEKTELLCYVFGSISKKLDFIIDNMMQQENNGSNLAPKMQERTAVSEDVSKKSFLDAALNGKKNSELSQKEINLLCSYTFAERKLESYKTIHFRGIKRVPYNLLWKMLMTLGIDKRKVKFMLFVDYDTLEIDLYESYVDSLTDILEKACSRFSQYRNLIIKRIIYQEKIMENESVENSFKKRMNFKLEKIKALLPQAPHLRRLFNYVALQIKSGTLNITMKPAVPYEVTFTSVVDHKLKESNERNQNCPSENTQISVDMEVDSSVVSEVNQN